MSDITVPKELRLFDDIQGFDSLIYQELNQITELPAILAITIIGYSENLTPEVLQEGSIYILCEVGGIKKIVARRLTQKRMGLALNLAKAFLEVFTEKNPKMHTSVLRLGTTT